MGHVPPKMTPVRWSDCSPDDVQYALLQKQKRVRRETLFRLFLIGAYLCAAILLIAFALNCGDSEEEWGVVSYVQGLPVCSSLTAEEIKSVTALSKALSEMKADVYPWIKHPPDHCLVVVRSYDDPIPEVCRKRSGCLIRKCADRWRDLPEVVGLPTKDGIAYSGFCGGEHVIVSHYGTDTKFHHLLAHEYMHAVTGWGDSSPYKGSEQWAFSMAVKVRLVEILREEETI